MKNKEKEMPKSINTALQMLESATDTKKLNFDKNKDWYARKKREILLEEKQDNSKLRLNENFIQEFCYQLSKGHSIKSACRATKISDKIISKWLKYGEDEFDKIEKYEESKNEPYPEESKTDFFTFYKEVNRAQFEAEDHYLNIIRREAEEGKEGCAMWILERRHADTWGKKDKVSVEGKASVQHIVLVPKEAKSVEDWTKNIKKRKHGEQKVIETQMQKDGTYAQK